MVNHIAVHHANEGEQMVFLRGQGDFDLMISAFELVMSVVRRAGIQWHAVMALFFPVGKVAVYLQWVFDVGGIQWHGAVLCGSQGMLKIFLLVFQ